MTPRTAGEARRQSKITFPANLAILIVRPGSAKLILQIKKKHAAKNVKLDVASYSVLSRHTQR
jgi:hypothetical protein